MTNPRLPAEDAAATLLGLVLATGYPGRREGIYVHGVPGWRLCATDRPDRVYDILVEEVMTADEPIAVAWLHGGDLRISVLQDRWHAALAVASARTKRAVRTVLGRIRARAFVVYYPDPAPGIRVVCCELDLIDWRTFLACWRFCGPTVVEATGPPEETLPRRVAHDYDKVRAAEIERETDEDLRRHGRCILTSPAGFETMDLAPPVGTSGGVPVKAKHGTVPVRRKGAGSSRRPSRRRAGPRGR